MTREAVDSSLEELTGKEAVETADDDCHLEAFSIELSVDLAVVHNLSLVKLDV